MLKLFCCMPAGLIPVVQLCMNVNRAGAFNDQSFGNKKAQACRLYKEVFHQESAEPLVVDSCCLDTFAQMLTVC